MHMGPFAVACQKMMQRHLSQWCQVATVAETQVKNCSRAGMTAVSCYIAPVTDSQFVFRLEWYCWTLHFLF